MTPEQWTAVDSYLGGLFVPPDPALDEALQASAAAGLPTIHVPPTQGKLLHLLARLQGARTILEVGTLGGYSTIWLARALPAGGHSSRWRSTPTTPRSPAPTSPAPASPDSSSCASGRPWTPFRNWPPRGAARST